MKYFDISAHAGIPRLFRISTFFIFFIFVNTCQAQNEAWYIETINQNHFGGRTEVTLKGGRADIVNNNYAIEVEFASKWKNAIGQALWYGLQLERKPGIVLVMKDINDRKYGIMLQSAIDYAGLTDKIKVWFIPKTLELHSHNPYKLILLSASK